MSEKFRRNYDPSSDKRYTELYELFNGYRDEALHLYLLELEALQYKNSLETINIEIANIRNRCEEEFLTLYDRMKIVNKMKGDNERK